ncbi:MAG: hypothetical protein M1825_003540 [Sarcosagium campestre]|nr:MAG: hypothetical protein M1825_003540 [Sarcosagium campestre]
MSSSNIYILAANNDSNALLPLLRSKPQLVSSQDEHGYSLVHALVSYGHIELLRRVVQEFREDVNVDIRDEDGESPIFQAESVEMARFLREELAADTAIKNIDGLTAAEKIEAEADWPLVAAYLLDKAQLERSSGTEGGQADLRVPPRLPPNVSLNVGTIDAGADGDSGEVVDPAFKMRIEELAARDDFNSEAGQNELRELITAAVKDHVVPGGDADNRDTKRRLG